LPEVTTDALEWFEESAAKHCAEHQPRLDEWATHLRSRSSAGEGPAPAGGGGAASG